MEQILNKPTYLIILIFAIVSCNKSPQVEKILNDTINKHVNINFDSIYYNERKISFKDFREKFEYISIVYLENGCNPCYPKFIDWQLKKDFVHKINSNYNVLYIIKGNNLDSFFKNVRLMNSESDICNNCYIILDQDNKFLKDNPSINLWAIDRTILIDINNNIKIIGAPFLSEKMMNLYKKNCLENIKKNGF